MGSPKVHAATISRILREAGREAWAVRSKDRCVEVVPASQPGPFSREKGGVMHKILIGRGYAAYLLPSGRVAIFKEAKS